MTAVTAGLLHTAPLALAERRPDLLAVTLGDATVRYGELAAASERIAWALRERGVAARTRVGLWLTKSPLALASMLAVLRLGAAYVPLDPLAPAARVRALVADCRLAAVVIGPELPAAALDGLAPAPARLHLDSLAALPAAGSLPAPEIDAEDLAYVLYTSGTTGEPKGVCISHRAARAFVDWAAALVDLGPEDRLASHAPLHFDLSIFDVHAAFQVGASVHLVPAAASWLGPALVEFVARQRISVWYSVPSALILMLEPGGLLALRPSPLRVVAFAGEVFPLPWLRRLREGLPAARLFNWYGPTETNVCTSHEVAAIEPERARPVPIGRPCCGDRVELRPVEGAAADPDERGGPWAAGPGERGELWVEGPTLMRGYWGRPALQGPYRTGDIVTRGADGTLEYVGRRDHQVKLRGHRVELGEVEAVLLRHPGLREACVLVLGAGLAARLIAFVVAADPARAPTLLQLKQHCREHLPRSMILDGLRRLDALPRTGNGKVDRRALADHHADHPTPREPRP